MTASRRGFLRLLGLAPVAAPFAAKAAFTPTPSFAVGGSLVVPGGAADRLPVEIMRMAPGEQVQVLIVPPQKIALDLRKLCDDINAAMRRSDSEVSS